MCASRTVRRLCAVLALIFIAPFSLHAQRRTPPEQYVARLESARLAESGQDDSALVLLRQVTSVDSADAYLWRRYGQVAMRAGHGDEAAGALTRAYELGVFNRGITALQVAGIHLAAGRPSLALDWLERAFANRLQGPERVVLDSAFAPLRDSVRLRAIYPSTAAGSLSRDERWRRDIAFFQHEAQRMHVHRDRPAWGQEFLDTLAALRARVPASNDMSIQMGLRRAVAMLGDGHSGIAPDSAMRMLPLDLYLFNDGVFVVGGVGEARQYTGRRVVAIGPRPVEAVEQAVGAFITGENEMTLRARLPDALVNTAFLAESGLANPDGSVDVTLEDGNGHRAVVRLAGGPRRRTLGLRSPIAGPPPFYLDRRSYYWTRDLPEVRGLYLNFNAVAEQDSMPLEVFARNLAGRLRNPDYRTLVVDARLNGGGNTFLLPPLIQAIASFAMGDTGRQVFVITSRHTYSAAQNFVSKLEWLVDPVFVGEPTGSSPNFTGELAGTTLPYSGLQVYISNRIHMNSDWEDQRSWIAPQIPAPLSSADFFAGRDPAMEAIMTVAGRGKGR